MKELVTLKLFRIGGAGKAYLFSKTQKGVRDTCAFYLPKSSIVVRSMKNNVVGEWEECQVSIPEWLVKRRNLR